MARIEKQADSVRIHLQTNEDCWFWERRFNVFDFLDIFPAEAISPKEQSGSRGQALHFETDAGFDFDSDIVRDGFYLRNQAQGTRRWMAAREIRSGDIIVIERLTPDTYRLSRDRSQ
ncbi:MAG: hypothetical protein AB1752_11080 [Candidatus Zixiibacteriota bacterium]